MTDYDAAIIDAAIIEAAEAYAASWTTRDGGGGIESGALVAAVRRKREVLKPRLLTADEAQILYDASCGPLALEHPKAVRVVLDAAMERALKVIEGLERYVPCVRIKERGAPLAVSENALAADERCAVMVHDIRSALVPR